MTEVQLPFKNPFQGISRKKHNTVEIRLVLKEMKPHLRRMSVTLLSIHNGDGMKKIPESCQKARGELMMIKECFQRLLTIVPVDEFYKYRNMWKHHTSRAAHLVLLVVFLETGKLCSRKEFAKAIGVTDDQIESFPVNIEEYLFGLMTLVSDLVRFALNCVTYRDYSYPVQIANFVISVSKSLNLLRHKKDGLRRRSRSMKYDVKVLEEVIYDLSLRNHLKPDALVIRETDKQQE